jgi:hypothetical protein
MGFAKYFFSILIVGLENVLLLQPVWIEGISLVHFLDRYLGDERDGKGFRL